MAEEITRLCGSDYDEAIDFLDLVFSSAHGPHNFATLLPGSYRPTDEHMNCNYAIRRNGRLRAIVGMFPRELCLGDTVLRQAGIGGVSCHRKDRGSGFMSALMNHCVQRMKEEGCQVSCLGGARQRYQNFGYELCGITYSVDMNRTNVRAFAPLPIEFHSHNEIPQACLDLQQKLPIHGRRTLEEMQPDKQAWGNRILTATRDGKLIGYVVADKPGNHIVEFAAEERVTMREIICAWVQQNGDLSLTVDPFHAGLFGDIAEGVRIGHCGNWRIFDWQATLTACMKLRNQLHPLADGSVKIRIEDQELELTVDGGEIRCRSGIPGAVHSYSALTAMRLFFGPLPPCHVCDLPPQASRLHDWCPLPLYIPKPDCV